MHPFNQQVHFGSDAGFSFLQEVVRSKDSKRIFLVTGKSSFSMSGAETWLQDLLSECSVVRFSDFSENPTVSEVEYALSVYRKKPPDLP